MTSLPDAAFWWTCTVVTVVLVFVLTLRLRGDSVARRRDIEREARRQRRLAALQLLAEQDGKRRRA